VPQSFLQQNQPFTISEFKPHEMISKKDKDANVIPAKSSGLATMKDRSRKMKILFVMSMAASAIVFGTLAYRVTADLERDTASSTYYSIVDAAVEEAKAITQRKRQGAESLASLLSHSFPDASQWPFVGLRGYSQTASLIAELSHARGHGFLVIVKPDQVTAFEAHAMEFYEQNQYPKEAGRSELGFGIRGTIDSSSGDSFHDVAGNTTWNSRYDILVPLLQFQDDAKYASKLLQNFHQFQVPGKILENIIDCVQASKEDSRGSTTDCGGVTDFMEIDGKSGAGAMFLTPIFPANDPTEVVGFISTTVKRGRDSNQDRT